VLSLDGLAAAAAALMTKGIHWQ